MGRLGKRSSNAMHVKKVNNSQVLLQVTNWSAWGNNSPVLQVDNVQQLWIEGEYFSDIWTIVTFMVVLATLAILLGRWYLIITHRRKVAKEKV